MSRFVLAALLAFALSSQAARSAVAQDAQQEASAVVAREQGEAAVNAITTPTTIDTPANAGSSPNTAVRPVKPGSLKHRAGEQHGSSPVNRANVLGMYIQEGERGQVRIVDVGTASPAYDAGVRRGDEILQFAGFKAENYRKWIDGIRRLVTDAPDESLLPVTLERDGQIFTTKIRVPVASTGRLQLPMPPLPTPSQFSAQSPSPVPTSPDAGGLRAGQSTIAGGANINVGNGPLFNFFGNDTSTGAKHAIAELVRVGDSSRRPPGGGAKTSTATGGGTTASEIPGVDRTTAHIGLAGFRSDASGMMVMVDVGNLRPGNYTVAIEDPAVLSGNHMGDTTPRPSPTTLNPTPKGEPTAPDSPNSSNAIPANVDETRSTTLDDPNTGQDQAALLENSAQHPQPNTPTAATDQSASSPTAKPAADPRGTQPPTLVPPLPPSVVSATPMLQNVGTITVDQSGTGRFQQHVDIVKVRTIIGQAIVLYTQSEIPTTTLPSNLDTTIDPVASNNESQPDARTQANDSLTPTGDNSIPSMPAASKPVAGGVIRLLSVRNPQSNASAASSELNGSVKPQQRTNTPTAPANKVR